MTSDAPRNARKYFMSNLAFAHFWWYINISHLIVHCVLWLHVNSRLLLDQTSFQMLCRLLICHLPCIRFFQWSIWWEELVLYYMKVCCIFKIKMPYRIFIWVNHWISYSYLADNCFLWFSWTNWMHVMCLEFISVFTITWRWHASSSCKRQAFFLTNYCNSFEPIM